MEYSSNSDKITRDYFDSLLLETRYLDSDIPSTKMELFGEVFDTPIMTAALSHLHNTTENGMVIYAEAAKKANAVHWVGMGSDEELEQIIATGARTIKIIKPYEDNNEIFRKIEHGRESGCFALGMDIDHSFSANGNYDDVLGFKMKSKSTEELAEFVSAAKIPFVVKGVQSTQDAVRCLKAGCAGIVVSHHHNMMAYSVPPLMILPEIISAVSNEIPVFVDCGIESGMDAYKCLALGATAVSVGRHLMPLLKEGSDNVSARMKEMNGELAGIMARTGVKTLSDMELQLFINEIFKPPSAVSQGGYMYLGVSSCLSHNSPEEWARKHVALGLKCVNFPVNYLEGKNKYLAYKKAADDAGLVIAEVGVWKNTLAADPKEKQKWIEYATGQLKMADEIGALCCVNVAGTPHGPRWDGGYKENFSKETWAETVDMVQQIIDTAKPKTAKYSIESMPWMVPSTPEEYSRFINDVNRSEFCAHLDVVNMITSPDKYFFNDKFLHNCFDILKGQIHSCHLKDIRLKEEYTFQLQECACGEGSLDIPLYIQLAEQENPNMPMIIEHLTTDSEYEESVRYIQKL